MSTLAVMGSALIISCFAQAGGRTYYWSSAQATAAMMAQAKTPLCKVDPNEPGFCVNGQPVPGQESRVAVGHAGSTCSGEPAYAKSGLYSRFICQLQGANGVGHWTLEVLTSGPTTIRWRLVK
jgi:hypothetical protein